MITVRFIKRTSFQTI